MKRTIKRKANGRGAEYPSVVEDGFRELFPSVYRFIRDGWEHANLIRELQRQESSLIIDPLYLCADTDGREGSLFAMGALLRSVAKVAADCGTTLKILHHMNQTSAKTGADRNPELFDSAWAGTQQFFRQWIAINRRSPYDPEWTGHHELRPVAGGSSRNRFGGSSNAGIRSHAVLELWSPAHPWT